MMMIFIKDFFKRTDKFFWINSVVISVMSLFFLLSVSMSTNTGYFKTQLVAVIIGYIGAIIIANVDYKVLFEHWIIIATVCILLIVYTLFFGVSVQGGSGVNARAWILLPGQITFQPSELAKIGFVITFSKHLSFLNESGKIKKFFHVVLLGAHVLVPMGLTHLQGDDGAAIIFFLMFLTMSFIAGVQLRYFLFIILSIVLLFPFLWKYVFAEYQKQRLIIQFNLESDPIGWGYQQIQGKLSIGSGKFFGKGLFHGPRIKYKAVPVQESDFIFSVIGEELGFIGCIFVILLLTFLLLRTIKIAFLSSDKIGSYVCFGFFGMVAAQMMFNLGMCLSLLPVMGVTLPFFSAGGSSSACLYLGLGLVQSVYSQKDDTDRANIFSLKQEKLVYWF